MSGSPAAADLRKRLAGKSPPPVVAAVGPEAWMRDEIARVVAEAVLGSADSPDLVSLRADDPTKAGAAEMLPQFFDEVRTGNLFGGRKVVVLRGAEQAVKADEKAFLAWLARPSDAATAVLLADELPTAVFQAATKAGAVVRCGGKGGEAETPLRFVVRRLAEREKRIGTDEARMLVDLVGDDLGALDHAAEILALHAGDEPAVTPAAIRALFPGARHGDAEECAAALLDGRVADALGVAGRCFDDGVPEAWGSARLARDERAVAMVLVRELARAAFRAADARRQLDAGVPRHQVEIQKLPAFLRDRYVRMAQRRRADVLDTITLLLEETDRGMKSGGASGRVAFARLATAIGRMP